MTECVMKEETVDRTSEIYGRFSDDGTEFIINNPVTPAPWINILSNSTFCGIITQTGKGYSFMVDPIRNRITRWMPEIDSCQRQGRYIYLKDDETGEAWSINGDETCYDHWEARHGLGYTSISSSYRNIECSMTYFVPRTHSAEVWMGIVKNTGDRARSISLYSLVELTMGNALDDVVMKDYYSLFNMVKYNKGIIWGTKNQWTKRDVLQVGKNPGNLVWNMIFFFTGSLPVESYECDRESFFGRQGTYSSPAALKNDKLNNSQAVGKDAVASLHSRIVLQPGETKEFVFLMGVHPRNEEVPAFIEELRDYSRAGMELEKVMTYWRNCCQAMTIDTPDEMLNRAFNVWNKYQVMAMMEWGDSFSINESGKTEQPVRDILQNLFTVLTISPDSCRQKILSIAAYQYFDGDLSHGIIPLIERGSRSGHSDHQLWLPYLVSQYCRETDDMAILQEVVPYHDRGEATLLEHCIRAIDFVSGRRSRRGLVLILNGDWNEALDHLGREGKGESVWLSMFLVYVMKRFIVLLGDNKVVQVREKYLRDIDILTTAINAICWDGEWYRRAFTDEDKWIGSDRNERGKIFLLPQAWSVISGVAPRDRGKRALESVSAHLDSPEGTLAMSPPYLQPEQSLGIITRYAPGKRENGGILKSPAVWRIMAECLYGNGNRAYQLLRKHMNVVMAAQDQDLLRSEPYFESEYIDGTESSDRGMGSYVMRACGASWMFRLVHDWICGIRLEPRGMKIDPCIPAEWDQFTIRKHYRGSLYTIIIKNPQRIQKGVGSIRVDGKEFSGTFIPVFNDGANHEIKVVLGREEASAPSGGVTETVTGNLPHDEIPSDVPAMAADKDEPAEILPESHAGEAMQEPMPIPASVTLDASGSLSSDPCPESMSLSVPEDIPLILPEGEMMPDDMSASLSEQMEKPALQQVKDDEPGTPGQ